MKRRELDALLKRKERQSIRQLIRDLRSHLYGQGRDVVPEMILTCAMAVAFKEVRGVLAEAAASARARTNQRKAG